MYLASSFGIQLIGNMQDGTNQIAVSASQHSECCHTLVTFCIVLFCFLQVSNIPKPHSTVLFKKHADVITASTSAGTNLNGEGAKPHICKTNI